jgi:hypothetical protein
MPRLISRAEAQKLNVKIPDHIPYEPADPELLEKATGDRFLCLKMYGTRATSTCAIGNVRDLEKPAGGTALFRFRCEDAAGTSYIGRGELASREDESVMSLSFRAV